jgi:hypothetical protein
MPLYNSEDGKMKPLRLHRPIKSSMEGLFPVAAAVVGSTEDKLSCFDEGLFSFNVGFWTACTEVYRVTVEGKCLGHLFYIFMIIYYLFKMLGVHSIWHTIT